MNILPDDICQRYLSDSCTENDYKTIAEWTKNYPEKLQELFLMRELADMGRREYYNDPKYLRRSEHLLKLKIQEEDRAQNKIVLFRSLMKYAAAVLILFSASLGVYHFWNDNSSLQILTASVAADEEVKILTLPDGTKVWLNKGSSLTYPSQFSQERRSVQLNGEAYFEVTRDRKKPFVVNSEAMDVTVLGTTFNLKSYKDSPVSEATLIEGEVIVKGNKEEGQIVLSPGQKAELNRCTGYLQVKQVRPELDAVWRNDRIPFKKATIFEIASTLERFYQVKIILSPDVSTSTYSGVLKKNEDLDAVLKSLQNSIPIIYRRDGNNVYMRSSL